MYYSQTIHNNGAILPSILECASQLYLSVLVVFQSSKFCKMFMSVSYECRDQNVLGSLQPGTELFVLFVILETLSQSRWIPHCRAPSSSWRTQRCPLFTKSLVVEEVGGVLYHMSNLPLCQVHFLLFCIKMDTLYHIPHKMSNFPKFQNVS